MSDEKRIDCLHYDKELGCCYILSDLYSDEPTLQPCVESPCEHYVQGCYYCQVGDEKCGTCVGFFDCNEDGSGDSCATVFDNEKCIAYRPMPYCSMCGRKLKGGAK